MFERFERFERMEPGTLKIWLIAAAALYLLLPYDLLPDFLGLPGRIDDVALMAWLVWIYRSHLRNQVGSAPGADSAHAWEKTRGRQGPPPRTDEARVPDAYHVLGVPRSASPDAIRTAYRARMQEYHPDKVAHLGSELQQLALEKSQQIQRAYRQLQDAGRSSRSATSG